MPGYRFLVLREKCELRGGNVYFFKAWIETMGVNVSKIRRRSSKVQQVYENSKKYNSASSNSSSSGVEFLTAGARFRSLKIDRQLKKDRESLQGIFKILLLGKPA